MESAPTTGLGFNETYSNNFRFTIIIRLLIRGLLLDCDRT